MTLMLPAPPTNYHREGFGHSTTNRKWLLMLDLFRIYRDFPSLRLGQLLNNAVRHRDQMFYTEDHLLYEHLYDYWLTHSKRGQRVAARTKKIAQARAARADKNKQKES